MRKNLTFFAWLQTVFVLVFSLVVQFFMPAIGYATPDPYLTGGTAVTGYSGTPTPITDLQIAGTGDPTVPVKLRVTSGTLAMTTTTGLTFTGSSTGSTLQFSGLMSNVNAALATLRYTRGSTGTDTLEASLVNAGEVFFPDNGHLYEYVTYTSTWNQAKTAAEARIKYSATGYLATITSQAENDFINARLLDAGWMGASDATSEGVWKWVTGPEAGTQFWSGNYTGGTVGGQYANWNTSEPNDSGGNEDCGQLLTGGTGKWNDLPCSTYSLPGYVVEYGSDSSPIDISSRNVSITTAAPNQYPGTPSSLGSTAFVGGEWQSDTTPTLTFTLSDADSADTVAYRIQIDNNADFASPVVDYTSAVAAQGGATFTVGQTAGSGTYAVGSAGQSLGDGQYYWRVKAIDNHAAGSSYATANSGSIAFGVDSTGPSTPGALNGQDTPTTETRPTWTWTASTDTGSGLASPAYIFEWSTQADFSSSQSSTSATNSFTIPSGQVLADGIWYVRVKALDAVGNSSAYTASDTITVDTTSPSAPAGLQVITSGMINTPTLSWTASTDATTGLASPAYTVEWSRNADFTAVSTATATGTTYTMPAALADGIWYFRIISADVVGNRSLYSTVASVTIDTSTPQSPATTHKSQITTPTDGGDNTVIAETTPATAEETTNDSIILNNFTEYTNSSGKELMLKAGQVIYFYVGTERHSVTVTEVHDDYVTVTIASTPRQVRIDRGKSINADVDGDGKNDIVISLQGVVDTQASLLFSTPAVTFNPTGEAADRHSSNIWLWVVIITLLFFLTVLIFGHKAKKNNVSVA